MEDFRDIQIPILGENLNFFYLEHSSDLIEERLIDSSSQGLMTVQSDSKDSKKDVRPDFKVRSMVRLARKQLI